MALTAFFWLVVWLELVTLSHCDNLYAVAAHTHTACTHWFLDSVRITASSCGNLCPQSMSGRLELDLLLQEGSNTVRWSPGPSPSARQGCCGQCCSTLSPCNPGLPAPLLLFRQRLAREACSISRRCGSIKCANRRWARTGQRTDPVA